MDVNKLDLIAKGWKPSEVDQASKIISEAESSKHSRIKFVDGMLLGVLGILMLINGFVCSALLIPFIYAIQTNFILVLTAVLGFVFGILFTIIIYDVEKIHHKHENKLFIAFVVNGIVNFYFILEFTAKFGASTKLTLIHNIYIIAGTYFIAFLIPHMVYQMRKQNLNSRIENI